MYGQPESQQTFHKNGQLAYEQAIVKLSPEITHTYAAHKYANRRLHPDGYSWVRVGRNVKYYDNGQLHWQLNYDDMGNVIQENLPSYRKDGTVIRY